MPAEVFDNFAVYVTDDGLKLLPDSPRVWCENEAPPYEDGKAVPTPLGFAKDELYFKLEYNGLEKFGAPSPTAGALTVLPKEAVVTFMTVQFKASTGHFF